MDIDALAEAYWASSDPQFVDDEKWMEHYPEGVLKDFLEAHPEETYNQVVYVYNDECFLDEFALLKALESNNIIKHVDDVYIRNDEMFCDIYELLDDLEEAGEIESKFCNYNDSFKGVVFFMCLFIKSVFLFYTKTFINA